MWVPTKRKTLDLALLSGYGSPLPEYPNDDFMENYKFFKNPHGETIARYVGPNSKNAPPKKAIWVPKKTIDALPVTTFLTMQAQDARYFLEKVRQNEYVHTSYNHYAHSSGRNFNAYSFNYARSPQATTMLTGRNHILLSLLFRSHLERCVWLRKPSSYVGLSLWVYRMDNG